MAPQLGLSTSIHNYYYIPGMTLWSEGNSTDFSCKHLAFCMTKIHSRIHIVIIRLDKCRHIVPGHEIIDTTNRLPGEERVLSICPLYILPECIPFDCCYTAAVPICHHLMPTFLRLKLFITGNLTEINISFPRVISLPSPSTCA